MTVRTAVRPVSMAYARALGAKPDPANTALFGQVKLTETWLEVPLDGGRWIAAFRILPSRGTPVVGELRVFPAPVLPAPAAGDNEEAKERIESAAERLRGTRAPGQWSADVLGPAAAVPRGGLSARLLRRIRLGEQYRVMGELVAEWAAKMPQAFDTAGAVPGPLARARLTRPPTKEARGESRVGRKGLSDAVYARWAHRYVDALASREPCAMLARRHDIPHARVRGYVREARRRELLTAASRGRKGGTLTAKARAILETAP